MIIHIRLCGRVSDTNFSPGQFPEIRLLFLTYLAELAKKDAEEVFHETFSKINITFLTNISVLMILSLILEKASQKKYIFIAPVIAMTPLY